MNETEMTDLLERAASSLDVDTPELVRGALSRGRTSRRRRRACVILGGLGTLAAGVAYLAIYVPGSPSADRRDDAAGHRNSGVVTKVPLKESGQDGFLPPSTHDHPCREGGQRLGTQGWVRDAPTVVGVPSSPLASQQNLESVWVCGGASTVLTYPRLTVTFEPGWSRTDQSPNWQALVNDWGTGSVETVDGAPAFVADVSIATPRGELLFVVDGTLVRIIGDGDLTAADLTVVGNSLQPA
jgi:hypothetical protein